MLGQFEIEDGDLRDFCSFPTHYGTCVFNFYESSEFTKARKGIPG